MTNTDMEQRIAGVVRRVTGHNGPIGEQQALDELGVDSAAAVEILIGIEEEFNVEFSDSDITMAVFRSITSLVDLMSRAHRVGA